MKNLPSRKPHSKHPRTPRYQRRIVTKDHGGNQTVVEKITDSNGKSRIQLARMVAGRDGCLALRGGIASVNIDAVPVLIAVLLLFDPSAPPLIGP